MAPAIAELAINPGPTVFIHTMANAQSEDPRTEATSVWSLPTLKGALTKLPLLVCLGIFLFHFSVIRKYAVNLPNMDDWGMFAGDNHPASVDLAC